MGSGRRATSVIVALADGPGRYTADNLPGCNRLDYDGSGGGDTAFAKTGAIKNGDIGAQPRPAADPAAIAGADALLGDGHIRPVGLIIAATHQITPRSQYGIFTNRYGTVLGGLDNRVGANPGTVSDFNRTFLARNHCVVRQDDFLTDSNSVGLGRVASIEQNTFAQDGVLTNADSSWMTENHVGTEHHTGAAVPKQFWPEDFSHHEAESARDGCQPGAPFEIKRGS